ncbi:hypothetical protein [Eubacterium sp.]|uniref:hypothetical protein n=1 Tax=Eubacterium sp. TaxID=142586 RepID=UPI002FCBC941
MKSEIIKERKITLQLSDQDCEEISIMAGRNGLSVPELLENFIADLTGGMRSNGSDERALADQWFDRCFGMFPQKNTLLCHLLIWLIKKWMEEKQMLIGEENEY